MLELEVEIPTTDDGVVWVSDGDGQITIQMTLAEVKK